MKNILFKVSFPAEFHAQTAVECAIRLHPEVKSRLDDIEEIRIDTHESAIRIIDKTGPLNHPADRDHCLQYMVAAALLQGKLAAEDYEDQAAQDPRLETLRNKMRVKENPRYSLDYHDPEKRSIASAVQIFFKGEPSDFPHRSRIPARASQTAPGRSPPPPGKVPPQPQHRLPRRKDRKSSASFRSAAHSMRCRSRISSICFAKDFFKRVADVIHLALFKAIE